MSIEDSKLAQHTAQTNTNIEAALLISEINNNMMTIDPEEEISGKVVNGNDAHEKMTASAGDEVNLSLLISDLTDNGMEAEVEPSTIATNLEDNTTVKTEEKIDTAAGLQEKTSIEAVEVLDALSTLGNGFVTATAPDAAQKEYSPSPPTAAVKNTTCVVCNKAQGKYKCSRCELPYCSLTCNTLHKATHPFKEPIATPKEVQAPPPPTQNPRAGTGGHQHPFAVLDNSKELAALFKKYPDLPAQLLQIERAASSTSPNGQQGNNRNGRGKGKSQRSGPLNQDPGLQNGLKVLYTARASDNGEGVREYGKLILQLMAKEQSDLLVMKEQEEESARYVALLLQAES